MSELEFKELNLSEELLKAVSSMGFKKTTPIQSKAIPEIISGKDIIGQASTGTGKTAAFGLPAIDKIDKNLNAIQVLVLCPTRELAIQVASEMNKFLKYKNNITALPIYGGQPIQRQLYELRRFPKIIIGTPGRTLDHIERGSLRLGNVKVAVLDEADEMLDMGFRQDIQKILKHTPNSRQTVLFSATMSREILSLTKMFQINPKLIKVSNENLSPKKIQHSYFDVEESRKTRLLAQLLTEHNPKLSIVFCNTRRNVDAVCKDLRSNGFCSAAIHGDIRQSKRDSIMNKFRKEKINILVATDVAARGIDVPNIEVIFNYGIPRERESYVHRTGRTGRAGKEGKAISLVSRPEFSRLRDIMRYANVDIKREKANNLPDLESVFASKEKSRYDEPRYAASTNTRNSRSSRNASNDGNSIDKSNQFIVKINDRIKNISRDVPPEYVNMINDLVDDNKSLEHVSVALLKMVADVENRPRRAPRRRYS
jgi:ATP-dependent RNA helicase DeaD